MPNDFPNKKKIFRLCRRAGKHAAMTPRTLLDVWLAVALCIFLWTSLGQGASTGQSVRRPPQPPAKPVSMRKPQATATTKKASPPPLPKRPKPSVPKAAPLPATTTAAVAQGALWNASTAAPATAGEPSNGREGNGLWRPDPRSTRRRARSRSTQRSASSTKAAARDTAAPARKRVSIRSNRSGSRHGAARLNASTRRVNFERAGTAVSTTAVKSFRMNDDDDSSDSNSSDLASVEWSLASNASSGDTSSASIASVDSADFDERWNALTDAHKDKTLGRLKAIIVILNYTFDQIGKKKKVDMEAWYIPTPNDHVHYGPSGRELPAKGTPEYYDERCVERMLGAQCNLRNVQLPADMKAQIHTDSVEGRMATRLLIHHLLHQFWKMANQRFDLIYGIRLRLERKRPDDADTKEFQQQVDEKVKQNFERMCAAYRQYVAPLDIALIIEAIEHKISVSWIRLPELRFDFLEKPELPRTTRGSNGTTGKTPVTEDGAADELELLNQLVYDRLITVSVNVAENFFASCQTSQRCRDGVMKKLFADMDAQRDAAGALFLKQQSQRLTNDAAAHSQVGAQLRKMRHEAKRAASTRWAKAAPPPETPAKAAQPPEVPAPQPIPQQAQERDMGAVLNDVAQLDAAIAQIEKRFEQNADKLNKNPALRSQVEKFREQLRQARSTAAEFTGEAMRLCPDGEIADNCELPESGKSGEPVEAPTSAGPAEPAGPSRAAKAPGPEPGAPKAPANRNIAPGTGAMLANARQRESVFATLRRAIVGILLWLWKLIVASAGGPPRPGSIRQIPP